MGKDKHVILSLQLLQELLVCFTLTLDVMSPTRNSLLCVSVSIPLLQAFCLNEKWNKVAFIYIQIFYRHAFIIVNFHLFSLFAEIGKQGTKSGQLGGHREGKRPRKWTPSWSSCSSSSGASVGFPSATDTSTDAAVTTAAGADSSAVTATDPSAARISSATAGKKNHHLAQALVAGLVVNFLVLTHSSSVGWNRVHHSPKYSGFQWTIHMIH